MRGMTRRDFLAVAGTVAGLAAGGGVLERLDPAPLFVRPPGAVGEEAFLSRCLRCGKCIAVCPARIVQPVSLATSLRSSRTPEIDFSRGYCDFCSHEGVPALHCIHACPSGALELPESRPCVPGVAVVAKETCVAWNWTGCTVCVGACPQEAIALDGQNRPVVDEDACDGCGLCENVCPSASLRSYRDASTGKGIVVARVGGA